MFVVSFPQFVYTWQRGRQTIKHPDEARKQRKSDLNGQVKIWQVHALPSVCNINKSWQKFQNHLLGALYVGQLLAHLSNIQVVGTLLKASQKTDSNVTSRRASYHLPYRKTLSLTEHTLTYTGNTTSFQCASLYLGNTKHFFFCIWKQLKSLQLESIDIRGTCILIYSYNKTNEMHLISQFYFEIELYMFRTGFLSIIRSLALYTQQ
jgi:hypothetical protein